MFLKSIPKLLGVLAMALAVGLGGSGTASASPPFDGGDSSCLPDMSGCHLYHFKLDGHTHKIEFNIFDSACGDVTSKFTVWRKNSANIWLNARKTSFFHIYFDGGSAFDIEGMESYRCNSTSNGYQDKFLNYENKCWHLTELRSRGADCDKAEWSRTGVEVRRGATAPQN